MSFLLISEKATRRHRQAKRHIEIVRILAEINAFQQTPKIELQDMKILEFGCGNGFQVPYLKKIGDVFTTDIYTSTEIRAMADAKFCESNITELPYRDRFFDLIFSNHVVEHLPDPSAAFAELRRVAKPDCLFAFSVPTNYWLLLALPAKYLGKLSSLIQLRPKSRNYGFQCNEHNIIDTEARMHMEMRLTRSTSSDKTFLRKLLPKGHGVYPDFIACYKAFRINAWEVFFKSHGFFLKKTVPLLLYGPSERPVIPTTDCFNRFGVCSSVLFLLKNISGPE